MDFRHVESRFRSAAMLVQGVLFACLAAYISYEATRIYRTSATPPVETTMEQWNGAGKWAICDGSAAGLYATGIAIPKQSDFGFGGGNFDGWDLFTEQLTVDSHTLTCAMVDLTKWNPEAPTTFRFCAESEYPWILVFSGGRWLRAAIAPAGTELQLHVTKFRHGWNFGYSEDLEDYFSIHMWGQLQREDRSKCSHWTRFRDSSARFATFTFTIQEPLVRVTANLGLIPQIFTLSASVGGYVTLLTFLFTCIFVKQSPHGQVAIEYDTRTLLGHAQKGLGDVERSDGLRHAPGGVRLGNSPAGHRMTE